MSSCEEAVSLGNLDGVSLDKIAESFGTPCFVYHGEQLQAAGAHVLGLAKAIDARVRYAVKANGNLALLKLINNAGLGFDVATGAELRRAMLAGGVAAEIIMTGPGKSHADLQAALDASIEEIVCDSLPELARLEHLAAAAKRRIAVGVRLNPAIDAASHPHLATGLGASKFGANAEQAHSMFERIAASSLLEVGSLSCHIGSQIGTSAPYIELAQAMLAFDKQLREQGITPARIDLGGGFGIGDSRQRPAEDPLANLVTWLQEHGGNRRYGLQPGRSIVGRCGMLLAKVEYRKDRHIIVDAAMTELMRPCLYDSHHGIAHLGGHPAPPGDYDVVGPVCENADFLARQVDLDAQPGEYVALFDCGAYASAMASGYNGRLRACEVLVLDGITHVIRHRDTFEDSIQAESEGFQRL